MRRLLWWILRGLHLTYNIPVQNSILCQYQPAELKPVALQMDSLNGWLYSNYIKVGIGNVHQPYVKAGFSFGDGKSSCLQCFCQLLQFQRG